MSFQPAASLTIDTAAPAMAAGLQAIAGGEKVFDFSGVTSMDSAAVAVLLGWQRAARARNLALSFINVPATLQRLAGVYGVADLLPSTVDVSRFVPPTDVAGGARSDLPHH